MDSESAIPLVAEHDSWISVDPVIGCPANCAYCYLGPLDERATKPRERVDPAAAVKALRTYLGRERTDDTAVCLGNHTDMCMTPRSRRFVLAFLDHYAVAGIGRRVCIVTKGVLPAHFVAAVSGTGVDVAFFLSQSFAGEYDRDFERGAIAGATGTLRNAELVSAHPNLTAVHFWRPFLAAFNPAPELSARIAALAASGLSSSVVTPLMLNAGIRRDPRIGPALRIDHDVVSDTEVVAAQLLQTVLGEGRKAGYPVYRNTSCALSLLSGRPEALGTASEPISVTRCAPCSCPDDHRSLCTAGRTPPDPRAMVDILARELGTNHPNWRTSAAPTPTLHIEGTLTEFSFNALKHQIPLPIVARSVQPRKAWTGLAARTRTGADMIDRRYHPRTFFGRDDVVLGAVERLRGVTGFVTTLCSHDDARPKSFARYFHILRVAWLADQLCQRRDVAIEPVMRIVWLHDLNRWPFAHNSERGNYSQADDLGRYFAELGVALRDTELDDLRAFHHKDVDGLSAAGRVALLADLITGMIEDPLLAIVGLNVSPELVPRSVAKALVMPLDSDTYRSELEDMARLFAADRDPDWFTDEFFRLFRERATAFLGSHPKEISSDRGLRSLFDLAIEIKATFMRPTVWPINNESVCHGGWLRADVIARLAELESPVLDRMLSLDEEDFVAAVEAEHRLPVTRSDFLPNLDAVGEEHPEIAFVAKVPVPVDGRR